MDTPSSWRLLLPLITGPWFAHEAWAEQAWLVTRRDDEKGHLGLDVVWNYMRSFFAQPKHHAQDE